MPVQIEYRHRHRQGDASRTAGTTSHSVFLACAACYVLDYIMPHSVPPTSHIITPTTTTATTTPVTDDEKKQEVLARYRRKKNTRNDVAEAEERERGQRRCADEEQSWMRPRKNGRFCSEGTRFVSITSIQPPGDGRRTISCEIAAAFARSAV